MRSVVALVALALGCGPAHGPARRPGAGPAAMAAMTVDGHRGRAWIRAEGARLVAFRGFPGAFGEADAGGAYGELGRDLRAEEVDALRALVADADPEPAGGPLPSGDYWSLTVDDGSGPRTGVLTVGSDDDTGALASWLLDLASALPTSPTRAFAVILSDRALTIAHAGEEPASVALFDPELHPGTWIRVRCRDAAGVAWASTRDDAFAWAEGGALPSGTLDLGPGDAIALPLPGAAVSCEVTLWWVEGRSRTTVTARADAPPAAPGAAGAPP